MFSEKLKLLRKEHNLTQLQLANELKFTKGAIAMWETSKRIPDAETLIKLSDYFNVSIDYLLKENSQIYISQTNKSENIVTKLSLDEQSLIKKYRTLDEYGKKSVNSILDIETERNNNHYTELSYVARSGNNGKISFNISDDELEAELDSIPNSEKNL